jgi:hypothetical protein
MLAVVFSFGGSAKLSGLMFVSVTDLKFGRCRFESTRTQVGNDHVMFICHVTDNWFAGVSAV